MAKDFEVNVEGLRLRESPKNGEIITVLEYGHPVEILKRQGGWSHIRTGVLNQPTEGYVAHQYLREIGKGPGFRLPTFGKPKITVDRLREFAGRASEETLSLLADNMDKVLSEFDIIKNPRRLAHFLAQLSHESAGFTTLEENLNYSGTALWRVFRRHFKDQQEAESFARQPEPIANRVYSNRMGNGPENSGDGFRYRGRGFIQLTGKNNYSHYGNLLGIDLVDEPYRASEPEIALRLASAYWSENGLNKLADKNNLDAITRRINGGINGLADRVDEFKRAAAIWAAPLIGDDGKPKKDRSGLAAVGTGAAGVGAAGTSGADLFEGEGTTDKRDVRDAVNLPEGISQPTLEEPVVEVPSQADTDVPSTDEAVPEIVEPGVLEPVTEEPSLEAVPEPGIDIPPTDVVTPEPETPKAIEPVEQPDLVVPTDTVSEPEAKEVAPPTDGAISEPPAPKLIEPPMELPAPPELDLPPAEDVSPEPEIEGSDIEAPFDSDADLPLVTDEGPEPATTPDDIPKTPADTTPIFNRDVVMDGLQEANDPENTLELSTLILAIIVVVLAIYLIWNRFTR